MNLLNVFKGTFGGRVNKMWGGALAPAVVKAIALAFGIEFAPVIEMALIAIITGGVVYNVPNVKGA